MKPAIVVCRAKLRQLFSVAVDTLHMHGVPPHSIRCFTHTQVPAVPAVPWTAPAGNGSAGAADGAADAEGITVGAGVAEVLAAVATLAVAIGATWLVATSGLSTHPPSRRKKTISLRGRRSNTRKGYHATRSARGVAEADIGRVGRHERVA